MEENGQVEYKQGKAPKRAFLVYEIIAAIIGAAGGFFYYKFYGCTTGTCPINSNPWISTLWGALLGYLLAGIFKRKKEKD